MNDDAATMFRRREITFSAGDVLHIEVTRQRRGKLNVVVSMPDDVSDIWISTRSPQIAISCVAAQP